MIVIYCYLKREKYKVLKFHVSKSADFGEEQHLLIKANTVICIKCFHVWRSGSKISVHIRLALLKR